MMNKDAKILIACEFSGVLTDKIIDAGFTNTYSCDIIKTIGKHPDNHLICDVRDILNDGWDLIIAFPPCTYLTAAGAIRLFDKNGNIKDEDRYRKGVEAAYFFNSILKARCEKIAVENPVQMKCFGIRKYDQIIEPYEYGDPWKKRTCIWLKNLPKLKPTNIVKPKGLWVGSTSSRRDPDIHKKYEYTSVRNSQKRAITFDGIAQAMLEQWILDEKSMGVKY